MLSLDPSLLAYAGPPCIGAFIGYLTNKIAIRMLFRPLHPRHVFGVRVPMTPGVIPSRRHLLAVNIGQMVGRHLLTSKEIGSALSEESFQEQLHALIDRTVKDVLIRDLGPVATFVPDRFKAYLQIAIHTLKYRLAEGVNRFIASDSFEEHLTALVLARLEATGDPGNSALLPPDTREALARLIEGLLAELLVSEHTSHWLATVLAGSLQEAARQGRTVGDLLPGQLIVLLRDLVREQAPVVLRFLGGKLAEPAIRGRMVQGMVGAIDHFLDSLGPVGAVARGFLEMESFGRKADAYLADKEGELTAWLLDPEVQSRMSAALLENVDALLGTPMERILEAAGKERIDGVCQTIASQLLAGIQTCRGGMEPGGLLRAGIDELVAGGCGSLEGSLLSKAGAGRFRRRLAAEAVTLLRAVSSEKLMHQMVGSMIDTLLARPLGMLANLIPHGVRQGATEYLHLTVNRMLLREIPYLAESLHIERIVAEKVDSLDLLQLERLLLSIMEEQFKYINLFGAMLGFLIGLINLAIMRLG